MWYLLGVLSYTKQKQWVVWQCGQGRLDHLLLQNGVCSQLSAQKLLSICQKYWTFSERSKQKTWRICILLHPPFKQNLLCGPQTLYTRLYFTSCKAVFPLIKTICAWLRAGLWLVSISPLYWQWSESVCTDGLWSPHVCPGSTYRTTYG
jgi:hypothetical protein